MVTKSLSKSLSNSQDLERGNTVFGDSYFYNAFTNHEIRNAFIHKVYAILAFQFAFTTVIISLINYNESIKEIFLGPYGAWIFWSNTITYIVIIFIFICSENCRRTVPNNYILLSLYTLCMSILLGTTCLHYNLESILYAAGFTFIVCLSVSVFSIFTKFDFTKWFWIMFIVLLVFFFAGIIMMFVPNKTIQIIYSAIGVGIFMIYLAIDTQAIMGGRELEISPEEYVLAVIHIYMDIINIFLLILRIISSSRE